MPRRERKRVLSPVAKSAGVGLVCGAAAVASGHVTSNASKLVSSEVGKAAIRIAVHSAASTATDAVLQFLTPT